MIRSTSLVTRLLALLIAGFGGAAAAQQAPQRLAATRLTTGMHVIRAELATTPEQRQIGLMHRRSMPTNDGMLFEFEAAAIQCFWMKDTLLPLAIAFIADDGTIVNIDTMVPETLDSHCPTRPVRHVLEMNRGWFASRGIKPGMKLGGAPFTP